MDEDLIKQFNNLPEELRSAITSSGWENKVSQIGKDNNLSDEQIGKLAIETLLRLLGVESVDSFSEDIIKIVGLDRNRALTVADEITQIIFDQINISEEVTEPETQTQEESTISISMPTKENILEGIESPEKIENKESSVSVSSLESNRNNVLDLDLEAIKKEMPGKNLPEVEVGPVFDAIKKEVFVKKEIVPEIKAVDPIPAAEQRGISRIKSMEERMSGMVVSSKQKVIVEEKTKLPESSKQGDSYREPLE